MAVFHADSLWHKRLGMFYLSSELVGDKCGRASHILAALQFIPTQVRYDFDKGQYRYIGLSPKFDVKPDKSLPQLYELDVTETRSYVQVDVRKVDAELEERRQAEREGLHSF